MPIIETHDVSKDVGLSILAGLVILEMDVFAFEGAKETLHRSIVIAVAGAAHADLHLLVNEKLFVNIACILAATVRMMQQSSERWPFVCGHAEGLLHQGTLQGCGKGPADNFAREEVQDHSQIKPALCRGNIGVGQPSLGRVVWKSRLRWLGATG